MLFFTATSVDTKTKQIIPVDLNSIMYRNAKLLSEYHLSVRDSPQITLSKEFNSTVIS